MKATLNKPLTRKQKTFVEHIVNNPKSSATEAAAQAYNISDRTVASAIATENLRKPSIVSELSKYNNLIEDTLLNTVNDWKSENNSRKREIAVDTAKYIHDKIHGRAKQQLEVSTTSVSINIDLTGTDTTSPEPA